MPRKSKATSTVPPKNGAPFKLAPVEWGGYIDLRLDDDDEQTFRLWCTDFMPSLWVEFVELVGSGFKFGLSYDQEGGFYLATFTASGKELIGMENRYCLTARAPDWEEAVALLLYKHLVMMDGYWGNYRPRTGRLSQFG
jgi:hypothetical protein